MHHFVNFAYLDAGTGSMVIQSVIGIVAGVGLFGRKALSSIRTRAKNKRMDSEKDV
ncbi:MAG: hypothetical protein JWO47_921 [Candidatus Saccharibacteria bacterium]|nr:hypothetical protein [Candidatus Saccharibacteria bacterium]